MTAIVAFSPPASATNRFRMTRSRTLSSAPPMMMTVPSATDVETPKGSGKDTGRAASHHAGQDVVLHLVRRIGAVQHGDREVRQRLPHGVVQALVDLPPDVDDR